MTADGGRVPCESANTPSDSYRKDEVMKLKLSDLQSCFWSDPKTCIDAVHPNTGLGVWGGRTLEQIREEYPNAEIISFEEAERRTDDHFRTKPIEITPEEYDEALDVLPPVDWTRGGLTASFKLSELTAGNITSIYCRIGDRYWSFQDDYRLTHDQIVTLCKDKG